MRRNGTNKTLSRRSFQEPRFPLSRTPPSDRYQDKYQRFKLIRLYQGGVFQDPRFTLSRSHRRTDTRTNIKEINFNKTISKIKENFKDQEGALKEEGWG